MGARDAFVVPRQLLKGLAPSVDGSLSVYRDVLHTIGINQLDGGALCAQRHVVRLHGAIVLQASAAVECTTMFQMQVNMTF